MNFYSIGGHIKIVCLVVLLTIFSQTGNAQLIVAHRGASHDAPENTLAAFQLAWAQKADGIEGDFYLSRDGQIVCIHDRDTERTAGVKLEVAGSTLAELKKLDVGRWKDIKFAGQRIPTLQEVIATVPDGKRIIIELKVGPEIVVPMQKVLNSSTLRPQQILVISFNEHTIAESKKRLPKIAAHWLTGYKTNDEVVGPWTPLANTVVETIKRIGADGLGSQGRRNVFDDPFIRALNHAGIKEFHVWTIDSPDDARFYRGLGAWGITTNRPEFIRNQLDKNNP